jgi:hypothetical protein
MEIPGIPQRKPVLDITTRAKNVLIVYQDHQTREWAANFCPGKLAGCENLRCTWWNVNDLSEPGVLAGAVSTAIRADIIIVAALAASCLPFPFYVWVNSWLPHRHITDGKLITLVDVAENKQKNSQRDRNYFRTLARRGNFSLTEEICLAEPIRNGNCQEKCAHAPKLAPLNCRHKGLGSRQINSTAVLG